MTTDNCDVLVVGAGHNTLTAAAYLAACGVRPYILERNAFVGGGTTSRELTLPGFVHDPHATSIAHLQGHPLLAADELKLKSQFGLKFIYPESSFMTVFPDGDFIACFQDVDRTCAQVARFSDHDAEAYRAMARQMESLGPMIALAMSRPPPQFSAFIHFLEQSAPGEALLDAMMRSAYDVITERFEHPKMRLHMLKWSLEMACSPEEKSTGIVPLFLVGSAHAHAAGCVVGGTQHLSNALAACIEHHGGSIEVNAQVTRIRNEGGKARVVELADGRSIRAERAIVAAIHPHDLGHMVEGLDAGMVYRAGRTELSHYAGFNIQCALNEAPRWIAGPQADRCLSINMVSSTEVDPFRRMCDALRYRELPDYFSGYVSVHSNYDASRAPAGRHALSFFNWVPYDPDNAGPDRWDQLKSKRAEWMLKQLSAFCPNIKGDNILAFHVDSPLDMERHSPSFRRGDVIGLAMFLYQYLGRRPTRDLSQYRVPGAEGLYLCGPFMHPGGGAIGGGRATAIRIMEDLRIDYSAVIRR